MPVDSLLDAAEATVLLDECARNGWRVGSGPTESECSAVPHRIKARQAVDADNAETVTALEAMRKSDQWNAYRASRLCVSH